MNLKHHIGSKVRSARLQRGLTQERLANSLGKSAETVSNLERGFYMTGLDTLQRVGQSLGVPMAYFFEEVGDERRMSKMRLDRELEMRQLAANLSDGDLRLAIDVVTAIAKNPRE